MSLSTAPRRQTDEAGLNDGPSLTPWRLTSLDLWFRSLVFARVGTLRNGQITVVEPDSSTLLGEPSSIHSPGVLRVHHPRLYRRIVLGGAVGAGDAYLVGDWTADDLTTVLRLFARNLTVPTKLEHGWARLLGIVERARHRARKNTRDGSRKNIAAHYDLGNDFYALFLDDTMTYSCGVFPSESSTLREASIEKYDRICRKLELTSRDQLLEIGCGWGGFAIHAAGQYGCHVTATTISDRQYEAARNRVEAAGLGDRVTLLKCDYRDLTGSFDKIASIEMIEAVGHEYLGDYLQTVANRLAPHGLAAIQAITIPDQYYNSYRHSVDFIQKHIFPGGCLVALGRFAALLSAQTDLQLIHLESMPDHYARTLAHWRERFLREREAVCTLGYDERFIRAWTYYLSYCEAGFHERAIGVSQILLAKPAARPAAIIPRL